MDSDEPPNPFQNSSSSSLLKDISNFKTPKRPPKPPNFNSPCLQFFTASKETPRSTSTISRRIRPSLAPASARSKTAARRLKAFELEQSKSSRKEQIKKEQSLKSLSKSLVVWLNFLFQNPKSCGCDVPVDGRRDDIVVVRADGMWRNPKRMRELWWKGEEKECVVADFSSSRYSILRSSLENVCSFDDLMQRMQVYLSLGTCKEIMDIMTQVIKNIDEGRLKMKAHCPIVTDFGMKEKEIKILMSYNPIWLRIGLYIILGGDSLLSDISSEEETVFLKMVIEKQFLTHFGLAKAYAYNRKVEGLYRPGYYEALGNVILKRTLLLILILDRAKSQSSLPLKYGIDGVDGGSPLLFSVQSSIKSSSKMISDFLSSDAMHGEGSLLAHLVIIGYKVSYQQPPIVEFNFIVSDFFVDLKDGMRLCRAIQLLQNDPSILMKVVVPSDTRKKNLANCGVALQYLRQAGVSLYDEDGTTIMGDDVANGDKELTISLLWNMFVHLQLPLLMNKMAVAEELNQILGRNKDCLNVISSPPLEMLLNWMQAVCEKYDFKIDGFSSMINGKAIWCMLDHYFRRELSCSCSCKVPQDRKGEESIVSSTDYVDAVHNFVLSQKLTALLGNFPEVLQISDLLEHNGAVSEKSVVILLVFLSSQLLVKKNVDQLNFHKLLGCDCQNEERMHSYTQRQSESSEDAVCDNKTDGNGDVMEGFLNLSSPFGKLDAPKKFRAVQAWWQDMTEQNYKSALKPTVSTMQSLTTEKQSIDSERENAAVVIQSHFRRLIDRHNFLKKRSALCLLQTVIGVWLKVKQNAKPNKFSNIDDRDYPCETIQRHVKLIVDRHNFVTLKNSVLLIQKAARIWIARKNDVSSPDLESAVIFIQKYFRGWMTRSALNHRLAQFKSHSEAAAKIQIAWKKFIFKSLSSKILSATLIQSNIRRWLIRRRFLDQKKAILKVQAVVRGWITRKRAWRYKHLIISIQRHYRCWLLRKEFLHEREAVIKMQSAIRRMTCSKTYQSQKHAAIEIQRFVRGQISRNRLLGSSLHAINARPRSQSSNNSGEPFQSFELKIVQASVLKLQKWWRGVLLLKLTKSAIIIQCHVRGWIVRQKVSRERHGAVVVQRRYRCWLLRKKYLREREAIINIQSAIRCMTCSKAYLSQKHAAIEIQRFVRGIITRNRLLAIFAKERHGAIVIQRRYHCWLLRKKFLREREAIIKIQSAIRCMTCSRAYLSQKHAAIEIQRFVRGIITRNRLLAIFAKERHGAIVIQKHYRCWLLRKRYLREREAIIKIQSAIRCMTCSKAYLSQKHAAVEIQRFIRGIITRKRLLGIFAMERHGANVIQRRYRCWLLRKKFLREREAAIKIQSAIRCKTCSKAYLSQKHAAIEIQRFARGIITRNRLQGLAGSSSSHAISPRPRSQSSNISEGPFHRVELKTVQDSVLKLQRWWRGVLFLKLTKSATVIQCHVRGWIARQKVRRERHVAIAIQSHWKGYLVRKESRGQLQDLRLRVQKSAMNVDDNKRIINQLLSALSELLSMKSISGILHNCAILDMATEHSQKCCEELVAAGAIAILLKLIRSVSRSIPDQAILKHALSTLRNLARFPHLVEVLIDTKGSVEIIFSVLLRNKEEGYFIASEVLKKIFSTQKGVKTVQKSPAVLKRLHNLVEELSRKSNTEKRNVNVPPASRVNIERRLKEATELHKLILKR